MGSFISLSVICMLLMGGCATDAVSPSKKKENSIESASKTIKGFQDSQQTKNSVAPQMILPSVYEDVSVFDGQSITFSAENANLHQVLYSISKIAGVNLIIDKDVQNNIPVTLSVKDANLKDVLDIIMQMSGCYYVLNGNILHVKEYMRKQFNIAYVHSNSKFSTTLGGDTLSTATSGGGSSGGSSSGEGISGKYTLNYDSPEKMNNFYDEFEKNIQNLLSKAKKQDEKVTEGKGSNQTGATGGLVANIASAVSSKQSKNTQAEATHSYTLVSKNGEYTLNRKSGVLSVYDKYQNVQEIEKFIKNIKKQHNKQILIEAKILEVSLNKSHQLGINWSSVGKSVVSAGDTLSMGQTLGLSGAVAGTMTYNLDSFNALINAIDENGDIDTLSNPRIKVLNGEAAIISSGKLVPYWEKQVDTTQGSSTSDTQVTYNRRDILDGVTMGVTPTVLANGRIMLNITPISSSIEGEKSYTDEHGVVVATAPIINIKEAGTIIYAKDNDLILIGGLMSTSVSKEVQSIPGLSSLPLLGSLFKKTIDKQHKKELVILLKIKVIE